MKFKKRTTKNLICMLLCGCFLTGGFFARPLSVSADDYDKQITKLQKQIDKATKRLSKAAEEEEKTADKIADLKREMGDCNDRIELLTQNRTDLKEQVSDMIALSYENRLRGNAFLNYLSNKTISDSLAMPEYTSAFLGTIDEKLEEISNSENDLNKEKASLKEKKKAMEKEEAKQKKAQQQLDKEIIALGKKLDKVETKKLEEEQRRREAELAAQYAAEQAGSASYGSSQTGSGSNVVSDGGDVFYVAPHEYTQEDLTLLGGIIYAEAGSVSYAEKLGVGSVVMNRVESPRYPNTISAVIYSPKQFSPVGSGRFATVLAQGVPQDCLNIAKEVLDGKRNVRTIGFKTVAYAREHGITGIQIGQCLFHD